MTIIYRKRLFINLRGPSPPAPGAEDVPLKRGIFDFSKVIQYFNIIRIIEQRDTMNDVFRALSDPTRREILQMLKKGSLSSGQIAAAFPIGRPAISHHLGILKSAELVDAERDGQNIIYSLNTTVFQDVLAWMYDLRSVKGEES